MLWQRALNTVGAALSLTALFGSVVLMGGGVSIAESEGPKYNLCESYPGSGTWTYNGCTFTSSPAGCSGGCYSYAWTTQECTGPPISTEKCATANKDYTVQAYTGSCVLTAQQNGCSCTPSTPSGNPQTEHGKFCDRS